MQHACGGGSVLLGSEPVHGPWVSTARGLSTAPPTGPERASSRQQVTGPVQRSHAGPTVSSSTPGGGAPASTHTHLPLVENTLPAFRRSARLLRVDLLELDVQLTRDGQVRPVGQSVAQGAGQAGGASCQQAAPRG